MKLFNNHTQLAISIITLSLILTVTSCDNPAGPDEEEHSFPVGAVLLLNGEQIATSGDGQVDGQITVAAGEETALITIKFIAEDGDLFQPDAPESSLRWEIDNPIIAEVEQHAEDGKWRFHIIGKSSGSTTVEFQLYHGTHSDFDLLPIPVIVN